MSKSRTEVKFNIDPQKITSPQVKRKVKNVFDEMQDAFEREQVKGKGYENEESPSKIYRVDKK